MRKILTVICCALGLVACDKHDPILPGVRTAIFPSANIKITGQNITDLPSDIATVDNSNCPYRQDSANTIWDGNRKIFSGFPTNNSVDADIKPVCSGNYIYAGLTTGEVVKINKNNRQIVWIADIYRASNLTGGASMVDIIAPIVPYKNHVYAGGLGDAFCKLNATNGDKKWCIDISVGTPFTITDKYAFVVSTDDLLYAISIKNGDVFWRTNVKKQAQPAYNQGILTVGEEKFDIANGNKIK